MPAYAYTERIQIDFGHAGDYSHKRADVTGRVKDLTVSIGFSDSYSEVSTPSKFEFKLLNHDRAFTPDNTLGAYYGLLTRGTLVKYTASYNGTTYFTWIGKITKIMPYVHPHANQANNNYIAVTAEDAMLQLLDTQIFPTLQTDVLVSDALQVVMDEVETKIVYPYASSWSVVDVSVVDTAKVLSNDLFTTATSVTTLEYVGDNSADAKGTIGAQSYIRDIMQAELGGRFFWNGQKFEFQDRYYSASSSLSGAVLALTGEDIETWDYRYGDDLVNDVTVNYQPRSVGTAGTVIYSAERAIRIGAGQTRTVTCHYRDPDTPNARIGAYDILELVPGTDFIANTAEDGSGSSLTAYVFASQQAAGQSTSIALTNSATVDAYITTLQVRGTPLYTYERESVRAVDAQSVNDHDRVPKSYTLKLITDEETAQGFANIQVQRFKNLLTRLHSITFVVNSYKLVTSAVTIGKTITITESSTSHSAEYAVVGIKHSVDGASRMHRVTYTLSPMGRNNYWILGVAGASELDSTAIVAL